MDSYIGLDLGTTTLGVAYSDSFGIIYNYENFTFEPNNYKKARIYVLNLCQKLNIYNIVIGFPIQLDGNEGKRCESVKRFAADIIKENDDINFIFYNESFSTMEAKERLLNLGVKLKDQKKYIDMVSAYIILEDFLNNENNKKRWFRNKNIWWK